MLVTSGLKARKDHLTLEWFVPTTNYNVRVTQISDREGRAKIAQRNPVIYDDPRPKLRDDSWRDSQPSKVCKR